MIQHISSLERSNLLPCVENIRKSSLFALTSGMFHVALGIGFEYDGNTDTGTLL